MFSFPEVMRHWTAWGKTDKVLRFGQYWLNNFAPSMACDELFYEVDPKRALAYVITNFVTYDRG